MALILHLDTSGDEGLYFLSENGRPWSGDIRTGKDHASLAMPAVRDLLAAHRKGLQDVAAIAVCNGPGSYTGLRVGLASAKGLAYAGGIPLLLYNRLTLLLDAAHLAVRAGEGASPASVTQPDVGSAGMEGSAMAVALKARAGEWFSEGDGPYGWPAAHYDEAALTDRLQVAAGVGLTMLADEAPEAGWPAGVAAVRVPSISPEAWSARAAKDVAAGRFADVANAEPFYLKAAFAIKPKRMV